MKTLRLALILLLCIVTTAIAQPTTVLNSDFEANTLPGSGSGQRVTLNNSHALLIERDTPGTSSQAIPLDASKLAGQLVTVKATVQAENVSKPPQSWNGVKVMLVLELAGGTQYPQIDIPEGSYEAWQFKRTLRLPEKITKATLILGLEAVSGKVWFDDVSVQAGNLVLNRPRAKEKFTGHDLPRLRGFMHGPTFREDDIKALSEFGANQIRWQLNWVPMKAAENWAADIDEFDKWLDGALIECDKALAACEKYNIRVLVDLHTPPGGRVEGGVCRMFQDKKYQDHLLRIWKKIATRYKGRKVVYAYDLVNEVVEGSVMPGLDDWPTLATKAIKVIREIDPDKPIVFEPSPWDAPSGFDVLEPLPVEGVIYSVHMYLPHQFTHQGVHQNPTGINYPGTINGQYWDKDALKLSLKSVIDFQKATNCQIYAGEFSAARWAPDGSGARWLKDATDIFEKHGWDWSYHAFREWDGWSLEHGSNPENHTRLETLTDRGKVIHDLMAKNKK